jgi:hypothetical protein
MRTALQSRTANLRSSEDLLKTPLKARFSDNLFSTTDNGVINHRDKGLLRLCGPTWSRQGLCRTNLISVQILDSSNKRALLSTSRVFDWHSRQVSNGLGMLRILALKHDMSTTFSQTVLCQE